MAGWWNIKKQQTPGPQTFISPPQSPQLKKTRATQSLRPIRPNSTTVTDDPTPSQSPVRRSQQQDYSMYSKQALEEKLCISELERVRFKREKKDIMKALNESFKTISTLEESMRGLRDELRTAQSNNQKLELEKGMLVEQINKVFIEQEQTSTKLTKLTNELSALKSMKEEEAAIVNEINMKNLSQNHIEFSGNIENKKELQRIIDESEQIKELWRESLNEQSRLQIQNESDKNMINSLKESLNALTTPCPAFAIEKLRIEQDPKFMYACVTLEHKKELLNISLKTANPDTILMVINFLKCSLKPTLFDEVLFQSNEAVTYYLRYLLEAQHNRKEWKRITLATKRYDELGLYMYNNALQQQNPQKKLAKLQNCQKFMRTYSCLKQHMENIDFDIIELSLRSLPNPQK